MMGSGKDDVVVRVAATRECGRRRFHCFVRIARHSIVGLNRVQQPASGFFTGAILLQDVPQYSNVLNAARQARYTSSPASH